VLADITGDSANVHIEVGAALAAGARLTYPYRRFLQT
jgi:hypothetical protein